jgi:glycerol kinase
VDRVFEPGRPAEEMRRLQAGWRKAVQRARGWESGE